MGTWLTFAVSVCRRDVYATELKSPISNGAPAYYGGSYWATLQVSSVFFNTPLALRVVPSIK